MPYFPPLPRVPVGSWPPSETCAAPPLRLLSRADLMESITTTTQCMYVSICKYTCVCVYRMEFIFGFNRCVLTNLFLLIVFGLFFLFLVFFLWALYTTLSGFMYVLEAKSPTSFFLPLLVPFLGNTLRNEME